MLDCETIYNKNFLKTKIRSYHGEATYFYDKGVPKVGSNHTYLAVISFDSVLKKDENFYPQAKKLSVLKNKKM